MPFQRVVVTTLLLRQELAPLPSHFSFLYTTRHAHKVLAALVRSHLRQQTTKYSYYHTYDRDVTPTITQE